MPISRHRAIWTCNRWLLLS